MQTPPAVYHQDIFFHPTIDGRLGHLYYFANTDSTPGKILTHVSQVTQSGWSIDALQTLSMMSKWFSKQVIHVLSVSVPLASETRFFFFQIATCLTLSALADISIFHS